jgi:hypothetical protein
MPAAALRRIFRILPIIQFGYNPACRYIIKPGSPPAANFCQFFLQIWVKPGQSRGDHKGIIVDFKKEGVLKIAHPLDEESRPALQAAPILY